jgi:solute carrier family 13 (sodium-dependent dicarboxylate transporter), member 2/3/5
MANGERNANPKRLPRILLVDDEDHFRAAMKKQLTVRGYQVSDVGTGNDAIKIVRHEKPHVVVLDQKMPGMDGVQTLKEIKNIRPEVQVIMLTGHGSIADARETGKYDVFRYMQKPCSIDDLVENIEAAREERKYALARHEIPALTMHSMKKWLIGVHNARPGLMMLGVILFALIITLPTPERLKLLLTTPKTGQNTDIIAGYANYRNMSSGDTVTTYYAHKAKLVKKVKAENGEVKSLPVKHEKVAFRVKVMVGVLVVAALFWATGAIPVGMTALLVGVLMYFFGVLTPNDVAKAYAKDAVIFIFGVLAMAGAVTKTGLDRRIGSLLLGTSTSLKKFAFIFCPLLAVTASFLSEHALIAFIIPVLMLAYGGIVRTAKLKADRHLAIMMILMVCFVANIGGPGSPAAGGRNAVMLGILSDYGCAPSFGVWMMYGLPFVPVMALTIGIYFYFMFRRKIKVPDVNIKVEMQKETEKIGKMTRDEYITAGVLIMLILLWTTASSMVGMGGPVILALVILNVLGVIGWREINQIHWDVVMLYASACAMGTGLALTGAALWIADSFVSILPEILRNGTGLAFSTSLFTGILTNFMSDGATVAAIGPITVPMATLSGTPQLMVGLATAFSASFAHVMIIGTPNNAIAYSMARDPETGEQLVTMKDFFIHGSVVLLLSFAVLWGWVFLGYWQWIGFPAV